MATIKAKVVGPVAVDGVEPGGSVDLDDETTNIAALVEAGHVELTPAGSGTKADLIAQAEALGLPTDGTKAELTERIAEARNG